MVWDARVGKLLMVTEGPCNVTAGSGWYSLTDVTGAEAKLPVPFIGHIGLPPVGVPSLPHDCDLGLGVVVSDPIWFTASTPPPTSAQ